MKIDGLSPTPPDSRVDRDVSRPPARTGPAQEDRISLNGLQIQVSTAEFHLDDVRAGRVEALRLEVASGRYRPHADQVADAMLRDLGGLKQ